VSRNERQRIAFEWAVATFGKIAKDPNERIDRFIEEALELAQAHGVSFGRVLEIMDYVFSRPAGEVVQEVGGVGVTLMTYCESVSIHADEAEATEVARILDADRTKFREKQDAKAAAGVGRPAS
jgi:NTP pyrophosphatase (non-canonical NTP hydrolase)